MAAPDFTRSTVDTLAKRAAFRCSNPDCGVQTVGPNSDPEKSTTIGEAAHIMGAKPDAKRYNPKMTDAARAEITNGIWLCRNCHGKIDRDEVEFPAELLFVWRREHEAYVAQELGTRGDRLRYETRMSKVGFLESYSPLIQRIAIDKPEAWEWRFTAELMRELNKSHLKRLHNLQEGHYFKPSAPITSEEFFSWFQGRIRVMTRLIEPLNGLMDRLTASWGVQGEPGDLEEIHDVCVLIRDALVTMVDFEESLNFANIPDEGDELRSVVANGVGRNAAKLSEIPDQLDKAIAMLDTDHGGTREEPTVIEFTLVFDLPDDYNRRFDEALRNYERHSKGSWWH